MKVDFSKCATMEEYEVKCSLPVLPTAFSRGLTSNMYTQNQMIHYAYEAVQAHMRLQANTDLLAYVLQEGIHNRLTPRVIDIAYTAFMCAKQPNDDDGGPSDWYNDTKPVVEKAIDKLRKDLLGENK